jgi:hypothetical protein
MQQRRLFSTAGMEFTYYEGLPVPSPEINFGGDICLHTRVYTYKTDVMVVSGATISVMFTIHRMAKDVWPYLKDFNLWQNAYGYYYTGIVGDLEGKTFRISSRPNDLEAFYPFEYQVTRVIPEQLISIFQPAPEDGGTDGISPGIHIFMLNEYDSKTIVTVLMEHATRAIGATEEEAVAPWLKEMPEIQRMWRDVFIPTLKKLAYEGCIL